MKVILQTVVLLAFGLGWTQAQTSGSTQATEARTAETTTQERTIAWAPPALDDRRQLAVGDLLQFRILEENDPAALLLVASSGEIEVPLVGRVMAQGRTCKELAREIEAALEKSYYHQANVALSIERTSNLPLGRIFVTGQVMRQGAQQIPRETGLSVAEAILEAGGFADFANRRRVRLHRPSPDNSEKAEVFVIDVKEILEKGRTDLDVALQPGDYVIVPERMFNF